MGKFLFSDDNKRYHTWNYHLRHKFGMKVIKIALNGGFTCPNIDGRKGYGGCSYCSELGSGDFAGNRCQTVLEQFEAGKALIKKKWPEGKYMPYFQANTNTYAPVDVLKEKFEGVLKEPDVVGISIATRADCLEDDVVEYLADLHKRTYLIVELGLQSIYNETGERINRCHTYEEFLEGYMKLKERGINICVHLIDGLPGETAEMMIESARCVGKLRPHCIKLHLLHIIENTAMAKEYKEGKVVPLTKDEYVDIIVRQLEVLPPETVVQRLTGDGAKATLLAPWWSTNKFDVLNSIDKLMAERDTYQGKCFTGEF